MKHMAAAFDAILGLSFVEVEFVGATVGDAIVGSDCRKRIDTSNEL